MNVKKDPFPHVIIDDLWSNEELYACREEMPKPEDPRWQRFDNAKEKKLGSNSEMWGPSTKEFFNKLSSEEFCNQLQFIFNIGKPLVMDTKGGGYHCIPPGGHLGIHVDFNKADNGLFRRLNLLIYMNDDWQGGMGGELELWKDIDTPFLSIPPLFNRTVIFETSEASWHGHTNPTVGYWRRSLAAYYYSEEAPSTVAPFHDTIFK